MGHTLKRARLTVATVAFLHGLDPHLEHMLVAGPGEVTEADMLQLALEEFEALDWAMECAHAADVEATATINLLDAIVEAASTVDLSGGRTEPVENQH